MTALQAELYGIMTNYNRRGRANDRFAANECPQSFDVRNAHGWDHIADIAC